MTSVSDELAALDDTYLGPGDWSTRLDAWRAAKQRDDFDRGNAGVVESAMAEVGAGLRIVVNIGPTALLKLLEGERYKNVYERPAADAGRAQPIAATDDRQNVDTWVGAGPHTYFAAVALGGAGIRYYGEYCLVLKATLVERADPQLFDRDSYDLLVPPLSDVAKDEDGTPQPARIALIVDRLRGDWSELHEMVLMKVLPELLDQPRLVTSGTVAEIVLRDQEFIEVHLTLTEGGFELDDVAEVRESPDEVAVEVRLGQRRQAGLPLSEVERVWLARRQRVAGGLQRTGIRTRVVTAHGQGYQWK